MLLLMKELRLSIRLVLILCDNPKGFTKFTQQSTEYLIIIIFVKCLTIIAQVLIDPFGSDKSNFSTRFNGFAHLFFLFPLILAGSHCRLHDLIPFLIIVKVKNIKGVSVYFGSFLIFKWNKKSI